jgi:hypothetical protein
MLGGFGIGLVTGAFRAGPFPIIAVLALWAIWAYFASVIAKKFLKGPNSGCEWINMLRGMGYGFSPLLFYPFVLIPVLSAKQLVTVIIYMWVMAACTIAIKQSSMSKSVIKPGLVAASSFILTYLLFAPIVAIIGSNMLAISWLTEIKGMIAGMSLLLLFVIMFLRK